MNKYCVIARNFQTPFVQRLSEEVGDMVTLFNPWSEKALPQAEIYFFRSSAVHGGNQDLEVLNQIPAGAKLFNPLNSLERFRNKNLQYQNLLGSPFNSIPWMNLQGKVLTEAQDFMGRHGDSVVKPIRGQQGWGVEKLNLSSLQRWWEGRSDDEYLLQKFVSGDELRLFFIRDEYFLLRRKADGVAANFARGGEAEVVEIPETLRASARECIKNSGAFYGAIDLINDKEEYYFLELNLAPGIEQIEKVTGENILRKLLNSVISAL